MSTMDPSIPAGISKFVSALGIRLEYIYVNTPEQNGHIESFHKTLKKEHVWPHEFHDLEDARGVLREASEDYNQNRIHSALGHVTSSEFAESYHMQVRRIQKQAHNGR